MNSESRLTLAYFTSHPIEATRQLESWSAEDVASILAPYAPQDVTLLFEHLSGRHAAEILSLLSQEKTVEIMTLLPTVSAVKVLRQCDPAVQDTLLARLDQSVGVGLRLSMTYPVGTAAGLADPRVTILPPDMIVSAALDRIKRDAAHATYYHYVVEQDGSLAGLVTTKELLAAPPDELIATIMKKQVSTVAAEATENEVLQAPHWRLYHTLPVVDRQGRFIGALRYRTLRHVEEQSTVKPTAGPLPQALLQIWEAYALIGLHLMTDLSQAIETGVSEQMPTSPKKEGTDTDVTAQEAP